MFFPNAIVRYIFVVFPGSKKEYAYRPKRKDHDIFSSGMLVIVPTSADYKVAAVTRVVDYVKKDAPYPLYKMKEIACVATPKNIKRLRVADRLAKFLLENKGKTKPKDDLEWIDQIEMWDAMMN